MTTTQTKPRGRGRASVPEIEAPASSSTALDAITGSRPVVDLPIADLNPHPSNPRTDLGDLTELADSIRAHGVRQNLLVVPDPDNPAAYRLVIGHRRTAAARLAGLTHLPAAIDPSLSPVDQLELMLLENLQRTDLSPVEEADGYQGLLDLGVDAASIATHTGRSETTVRSRLRLVPLPQEARTAVHRHEITLDDAAAIADLSDVDQAKLVKTLGTSNFRLELAKVRERAQREQRFGPLLAVLRAANATELKPNDWGAPEGSTQERTVGFGNIESTAAELVDAMGPGWSWRWYYDSISVYRPRTLEEAHEAAESDARRSAFEAERDERNAKAAADRAVREEFATVTAATRRELLEHLIHDRRALTKEQAAHVVEYAAAVLVEETWGGAYIDGMFRPNAVPVDYDDADRLVTWLRVDLPEDLTSSYHRYELLPLIAASAERFTAPQRLLAALAAALEPISEGTWRYGGRSVTTVRWYELLERLGYVVSDAERAALVVENDDEDA